MTKILSEAQVHDLIINDSTIQDGLKHLLGITDFKLIHEDVYVNGITADFSIICENQIKSIVEVKGGNINITDYVRGIGQLSQYENFYEQKITPKGIAYANDYRTIYLFPSSVLRNNSFNIGQFAYPRTTMIIELNEVSKSLRLISQSELSLLASIEDSKLVMISQYYFRDNRVFEYYILLKYLLIQEQFGVTSVNRVTAEEIFLTKINTINNGNWRNAFITLSSLGLIGSDNLPTVAGMNLAVLSYSKFAVKFYYSYLQVYANEIIRCFGRTRSIVLSNDQFKKMITSYYNDRDVLYLTQSNNRYLSSFLNILRDDYGVIKFASRSKHRELIYNPNDYLEASFEREIVQNSIAQEYINRYIELIRR